MLRAVTRAREVLEKFGGMSFSLASYEKLAPDEQLFVSANLERALGSDHGWMYDDQGSAWGHRDNILGRSVSSSSCRGQRYEIAMGAGHVAKGKAYGDSETELFAGVCGAPPTGAAPTGAAPTGAAPTDVVLTWGRAKQLLHIG